MQIPPRFDDEEIPPYRWDSLVTESISLRSNLKVDYYRASIQRAIDLILQGAATDARLVLEKALT